MRKLALLWLLPAVAMGDVVLKNAGATIGPVTSINCSADAGLFCVRDAGSVGTIRCNGATAVEPGCVTPSAQTFAGNKTFNGNVITPIIDAGIGAIGSLDLRGSTLTNTNAGNTLLIASSTSDGTTSATVGALTLQCTSAITSTDLCVDIQDTSGNHRLSVQAGGAVNFSSHITTTSTSTGGSGTSFTSAIGAGAGGDGSHAPGNGGSWTVTGGSGGPTGTTDGLGLAGRGGDMSLSGGSGGADLGAVSGGGGGNLILAGGAAGPGATAGGISITGGAGGAASTSHASGAGGSFAFTGGVGGASAAGNIAAAGGAVSIIAGKGGTDTINAGAGAGGSVTIRSGAGGTIGSGSGGASGDVTVDTGAASGGASPGSIFIGAANGGNVTLSRSGKTVTVAATLATTGAVTVSGNINVGANGTSFSSSKAVAQAIDFANINAQTCTDNTLSGLTDCTIGDPVSCALPSTLETGLAGSCFMSASATVTFRLCNVTTGGINPASQTFGARCFH